MNTRLGIRPHDFVMRNYGVGAVVNEDGGEQDEAKVEDEIDVDTAEDAPIQLARGQGIRLQENVSSTTRRIYHIAHGAQYALKAEARRKVTKGRMRAKRAASRTYASVTSRSGKKTITTTRQQRW